MEKLLQLLVSGVALGAVYALLALGFVVVFKATQVVNFAHAGLLMVGTYGTARLSAAGGCRSWWRCCSASPWRWPSRSSSSGCS